jgi:hypothetical protein
MPITSHSSQGATADRVLVHVDTEQALKLDLTADERLVLPSVRREVFHPYTDRPAAGIWANCYAYAEAFAEKLRAFGEACECDSLLPLCHQPACWQGIVPVSEIPRACSHIVGGAAMHRNSPHGGCFLAIQMSTYS